jgi:hypothetical protein
VSEQTVLDKLDNIQRDIGLMNTETALNRQAYQNLNGELQEHKRQEKWRANRNIAICAIMFTALGCWIGLKGLDNGKRVQPTAYVKEIDFDDKNTNNN